ncbi:MAG: transglycosylase SLT domain-containing protein [Planctomycetota bacterium]
MRWALAAALIAGGFVVGWFGSTDSGRAAMRTARDFPAMRRVEGFREELLMAAYESQLDPHLLAAILFSESSGRVNARSHADALGLFQLMLPTAKERAQVLGLPEPTEEQLLSDPLLNARLGADYFAWLLDRNDGNVERALVAYNAGPTKLARWVKEAGGYDAWREERLAAGNSSVLAYAAKVERYRDRFRERGLFDANDLEQLGDGY